MVKPSYEEHVKYTFDYYTEPINLSCYDDKLWSPFPDEPINLALEPNYKW